MIAFSPDSPEATAKGKGKHGLLARMLSDQDLAATAALGLKKCGYELASAPAASTHICPRERAGGCALG